MPKLTRNRANQMLSDLVREIASEQTEVAKGGTPEQDRVMTKAEALARVIWDMALGWKEEEDLIRDGQVVGKRVKTYPPAQWAISLVYDRAEGKAAQAGDSGTTNPTVAERITDRTKNCLNKLAEAADDDVANRTVPPIRGIPRHPKREDAD